MGFALQLKQHLLIIFAKVNMHALILSILCRNGIHWLWHRLIERFINLSVSEKNKLIFTEPQAVLILFTINVTLVPFVLQRALNFVRDCSAVTRWRKVTGCAFMNMEKVHESSLNRYQSLSIPYKNKYQCTYCNLILLKRRDGGNVGNTNSLNLMSIYNLYNDQRGYLL